MAEMEKRPWRFTIEFDDEKAKRNGYSVDDLYDCVGKYAEQMGNVRIGLGTWQAKNRRQCVPQGARPRGRDAVRDEGQDTGI